MAAIFFFHLYPLLFSPLSMLSLYVEFFFAIRVAGRKLASQSWLQRMTGRRDLQEFNFGWF